VDSVFDTIIVAANTGKCDIVIADQFITPERQQQIAMLPYAQLGQQLMTTTSKKSDFGGAPDDPTVLCGHRVGVLSGAAQIETLKKWSGKCTGAGKDELAQTTFSNTPAGLQALQGGQVDLFFTDSPIAGYYAKQQSDQFATVGEPVENVEAGISVPKEKTGLQDSVNQVLAAMSSDGSYEKIFSEWGQQTMVISNPGQGP
jgi:polar amino acid transport system substrate-binding protein